VHSVSPFGYFRFMVCKSAAVRSPSCSSSSLEATRAGLETDRLLSWNDKWTQQSKHMARQTANFTVSDPIQLISIALFPDGEALCPC
jgi:hypothetical protein